MISFKSMIEGIIDMFMSIKYYIDFDGQYSDFESVASDEDTVVNETTNNNSLASQ